ncbi:MAG: ribonuclease HI [Lachnospiraceae bacterium]|nr:ribonuclease HI [Lachnospiraceae bacterium]
MKPEVILYTDGSSRGNPGPGGYGSVLIYRGADGVEHKKELSGGERETTNNRMELMGVIAGLEALNRPCSVTVHTDTKYVSDAFNQHWIDGWKRNGWKTAGKKPVLNQDLWLRLLEDMKPHSVTFVWVKGHAGNEYNERCDRLATSAADAQA